jgi:putative ATP-binding cassette transporter
MKTLGYLLRQSGPAAVLLAPLGLLGAACSAALMATIHRALTDGQLGASAIAAFAAFGGGRILTAYLSTVVLGDHAARSVAALRDEIVSRLMHVPYRQLERTGSARVLSALTGDVGMLDSALSAVPAAVSSAAMLAGGAAYLLYLSPTLFAGLSLLTLVCLVLFRSAARHAQAAYVEQRRAYSRLWELYTALTGGFKELKLHAARRKSFLEGPLQQTTEALRRHEVTSRRRYAVSGALNHALVLGVLGLVLFALPESSALRAEVGSGYVLVGLYLIGPLAALSRLWPLLRGAELALQALEALGVRLQSTLDEPGAEPDARPSVKRIELRDASFAYDDARGFRLGPVSMALVPGEIVFVVGGNGSGKSSLGRLLAGLYTPDAGELRWDDRAVGPETLDGYRQLWSAVFTDPQLFDRLYGLESAQVQGSPTLDTRAVALLEALGLGAVVQVHDGAFSTLKVSQGQHKRLALLVALLEDRPLYLFDEWAADQDPEWKQRFYRELLPELRARGKAVLVITHDDRYFDAADRVLVLRDGRLGDRAPG